MNPHQAELQKTLAEALDQNHPQEAQAPPSKDRAIFCDLTQVQKDGKAHSATTASKIGVKTETNAHILLTCKNEIYNKVHDTQPCPEQTIRSL